ncbi:MAG: hypothetical protein IPN30_03945 [Flavobacteriales bacterium]|nr:hypothetical protein [Flavobacteriales bacterium]
MATTFNLFDNYRKTVADPARAAAIAGTLKLAIFKSMTIGTSEQGAWDFFDDTTPGTNQVTGTGYTALGNACATPGWTGPTAGVLTFDAGDPTAWAQNAAGFSNGRRAILFYDTGTASTSTLVGFSDDFGADLGNVASDFSVAFSASGIYTSSR